MSASETDGTIPSASETPRRLSGADSRLLIALADPEGSMAPPPLAAARAQRLLSQAERHGVLPAVLRKVRPGLSTPDLVPIRDHFAMRYQAGVAFNMQLRAQAKQLQAALVAAGAPALLIKGQDFAENLYPDPVLRPTSDIDIIVPLDRLDEVEAVAARSDFALHPSQRDDEQLERKWIHVRHPMLMLEIQGNLVHAPGLRSVLSLGFDELCPDGDPASAARPSARLAIAGVHAASSHHFELLRLVVDVLQAARRLDGAAEEQALDDLVNRSGIRLALVAALDLADRLYDDARCRSIADALSPVRFRRAARLLIDGRVVMAMETEERALQSWRRSVFRELLKRGGQAPRSS
ncbi:nucleotidyltransferase family protein [Kaistia adipata]|uniref:nucleotidyltransferase family protein n=1 Tax=Kaistia adipata TaxID=166954 RepID=UPI0003F954C7|nr:nucleotidyltransferase family protein [Kaistia adipata]